jgi:tetratricopeptide (TPR) repeat protein
MSFAGNFLHPVTLPRSWFAPSLGLFVVALAGCALVGCSGQTAGSPEAEPPSTSTARAKVESNSLELLRAEAQSLAERGNFTAAAEIAVRLSTLDVRDPAGELILAFDWHLRSDDLAGAEADLRRALDLSPGDPRIERMMAQLLNAEGRRFEASQHVLSLARSGNVTPRELLSLVDLGGPFQLVAFPPDIGNGPESLFRLGEARHQLVADADPKAAMQTLDSLSLPKPHPAVEAFRGRIIAETLDEGRLEQWLDNLPEGIEDHPEYWLAIGLWCSNEEQDEAAIRAFGETLKRDPTERRALREMTASLVRVGDEEKAGKVQESLATLDSIFRLASGANAEQALWIAGQLQSLRRYWEAIGWYRHAFELQGIAGSQAETLQQRVADIRNWESSGGKEQLATAQMSSLLGFDIGEYSLPDPDSLAASRTAGERQLAQATLKFDEVAANLGVNTTFASDYPLEKVDFYLHQANGGGLAAFDYDRDGRCDLYVVQSGGDPNREGSSQPNQLFRQFANANENEPGPNDVGAGGIEFADVSVPSSSADGGYGQGVCAADINQDGFIDLLLANIGRNELYLNQGDGTFRRTTDHWVDDSGLWTSSVAVGDLDGDALPDIVEVNYVDDPLVFKRKCQGKQLDCTPQRFRAAVDRIFRNLGDGTFEPWEGAERISELPNYGFGAVIANFDGRAGNDLFISNDGDVNHYWKSAPASEETETPTSYRLREAAAVSGCAIGSSGIAQACMGIASGDFDRNGMLDLMITNFHNEPVNLFMQSDSGIFLDQALKYGLAGPTKDLLGFGCQAADFDQDGWLDLAINNGHIYDATYAGIPFQMTSQLFRGSPGGFSLQNADEAGEYWQRQHLGRTLALFDVDRDGRMDVVTNHLDQPIAILRNRSDAKHWVQIELVGVSSERDAVGARLVVDAGEETWTRWRTGGDGYMCSNEPLIHFGIGDAERIESLRIDWPSGNTEEFRGLEADQRYLIVEGEPPHRR